jgi:hypothetical protein
MSLSKSNCVILSRTGLDITFPALVLPLTNYITPAREERSSTSGRCNVSNAVHAADSRSAFAKDIARHQNETKPAIASYVRMTKPREI